MKSALPARVSAGSIRTHGDAERLVRTIRGPTPLEPAPALSLRSRILLKREDLGPNGSFKWRGTLCALAEFASQGARSVVTASTGNHGAATAWAAARLGIKAHVVVPAAASGVKCRLIEGNGAQLHRSGPNLEAAVERARSLASALDAPYFEDGGSRAQLLGAATIGHEIAATGADVVIAPLAVGALAGGVGLGLAASLSGAQLFGVQVEGFDTIGRALRGEPAVGGEPTTFADGLADNRIVEPAFTACREHLDGITVVREEALERAVVDMSRKHGIVVEGAGAAALAGLGPLQVESDPALRIVLIVSGRNIDPKLADRLLSAGPRIQNAGPGT